MPNKEVKNLYKLFAEILDYPSDPLPVTATECARLLSDLCPEAAEEMQAFAAFVQDKNLSEVQEIYTRTFDITPTTTLYVGYHLFGESYKRGAFLARLQEEFQKYAFSKGVELPDNLSVLLRFASISNDEEFVNPLLHEAVLPALEKMETAFQQNRTGYGLAISSLRLFLRQECRELVEAGGLQND